MTLTPLTCKYCKTEKSVRLGRHCCSRKCQYARLTGNKHSQEWIDKVANSNRGKKRTLESRKKMSVSHLGKHLPTQGFQMGHPYGKRFRKGEFSGENHPLWIKDRSKLSRHKNKRDYASVEWRSQVYLRDDRKCKIGSPLCKGRLEVHHILSWKRYPELRYDTNNGITLCFFHHPRQRDKEIELSPYFKSLIVQTNPYDLQ